VTDHAHTLLILTDAESRLIREHLHNLEQFTNDPYSRCATELTAAFNRGIVRGTERMQAEFSEQQRKRKAGK
jgi:hypothetical protein